MKYYEHNLTTSLRQKYINNEKLKCLIEIQRRNSLSRPVLP